MRIYCLSSLMHASSLLEQRKRWVFSALGCVIWWVDHNTNLSTQRSISKTVKVNSYSMQVFERVFNIFSNDIQVDRICTCGSLVIDN